MDSCFIQGDCLEVMPTLKAESFDLVIADQPYWKVVGESVSMLDILSTLPESITLNHAFLKLCFDKGSDVYSFIDDIRYMSDKSEGMKLLKAAVESKAVDLNGIYDEDDNETVFMEILSNLKPSVEDVKWMLTHGANPDTKDEDGDTAIAYTDDPKIQELLR